MGLNLLNKKPGCDSGGTFFRYALSILMRALHIVLFSALRDTSDALQVNFKESRVKADTGENCRKY